MKTNDFIAWQTYVTTQTEAILQRTLPEKTTTPHILHKAMRYSALDGGKRLRPLLVWATSELGHRVQAACEAAMAAVECIHVYSLVHDDMPAMDNDNLRRGKPTTHVQFGEAMALLAGDALQALAFDVLSQPTELSTDRQLKMIQVLAQASGSLGMAGGQASDLTNVGKSLSQQELEQMHRLKTGALIRASVQLGALSCPDLSTEDLTMLDRYAMHLGLAFQVIDDVLDCEADTATLGKTAGKDIDANKPTYVKLLGLTPARQYAEYLINQSIMLIKPFGNQAEYLRQLAEFVIRRKN